jgi:hypothetical protein
MLGSFGFLRVASCPSWLGFSTLDRDHESRGVKPNGRDFIKFLLSTNR